MQSAKDTFYLALRDRLATLNPSRTLVVRGAVRPAMTVVENELVAPCDPLDAFVLTWTTASVDSSEPLPLHTLACDISYATRGTTGALGMDRGRVLDAMDRELRNLLQPARTVKQNFEADPVTTQGTNLFWSEPRFGAASAKEGQIARTVPVSVFALQEAGD